MLPLPRSLVHLPGALQLRGVAIAAPTEVEAIANHLADELHRLTGHRPVLAADGAIELEVHPDRLDLGDEGYQMLVGDDGAAIVAGTAHGLWNGVSALVQSVVDDRLPACEVVDSPRFAWRGAMLDVARHFFTVEEVKRFITLLSRYRLNRLHLHLTDDQGWRLDIPGWPALARHGGSTATGNDPGGFYTLDDWRDIVEHAERHFVTVVPEIDMPGHTNAALASVPELNVDDLCPPLYTGKQVGFSSLRMHLPATQRFVHDVVRTVAELTPGPWLHIGGDEAHSTEHHEYVAFIELLQREVAATGKHMVAWEEAAAAPLHRDTLVQHWLSAEKAATATTGVRFVLSPARHTYLDMRHAPDDRVGRRWAGDIDLDTVYDWDPAEVLPGVPAERIVGVEAPIWTEKVPTYADVEELCFPRLLCLAEVGWTAQHLRDWDAFRLRLARAVDDLRADGVNAYRSVLLEDSPPRS
ncbi:MAG: hypothetical protein RI900_2458 [Actinomycetota bacterium]